MLALINETLIGEGWMLEALLRLLTAACLGAFIGAEREHHGRIAGYRTQLLVALGSCLAMIVSLRFVAVYATNPVSLAIRVDPSGVAYGIMGGIGFLGAGAIIRSGLTIRGLTTAASLWCTAAIGLACGLGMYIVAAIGAGIVLLALVCLSSLPARWPKTVVVHLPRTDRDNVAILKKWLLDHRIAVEDFSYQANLRDSTEQITFQVTVNTAITPKSLLEIYTAAPDIVSFSVN
jgi:putative Mg2+ transporter-C (MgtC) family protein